MVTKPTFVQLQPGTELPSVTCHTPEKAAELKATREVYNGATGNEEH
jgi:hypothetical protein